MSNASNIIDKLQAGDTSDELAHQLLKEFFRGHPLIELKRLFLSQNTNVVKIAVWIASELGEESKPIISAIAPLLSHQSKYVRFFAIDSFLSSSSASNVSDLVKIVALLSDSERSVRWKAMDFFVRIELSQLRIVVEHLKREDPQEKAIFGISLLLNIGAESKESIKLLLDSADPLERRLGAVCAARAIKNLPEVFEWVVSNADVEIQDFAKSVRE